MRTFVFRQHALGDKTISQLICNLVVLPLLPTLRSLPHPCLRFLGVQQIHTVNRLSSCSCSSRCKSLVLYDHLQSELTKYTTRICKSLARQVIKAWRMGELYRMLQTTLSLSHISHAHAQLQLSLALSLSLSAVVVVGNSELWHLIVLGNLLTIILNCSRFFPRIST